MYVFVVMCAIYIYMCVCVYCISGPYLALPRNRKDQCLSKVQSNCCTSVLFSGVAIFCACISIGVHSYMEISTTIRCIPNRDKIIQDQHHFFPQSNLSGNQGPGINAKEHIHMRSDKSGRFQVSSHSASAFRPTEWHHALHLTTPKIYQNMCQNRFVTLHITTYSMYIYIYICVCVPVCVCVQLCS